MGARDSLNHLPTQALPGRIVGVFTPAPVSEVEQKRRDEFSQFLEKNQKQYEVNGVFVEPDDDTDDGFTNRMTGI